MSKDSEPRGKVTPEELAKMSLPEKVKQYATDVVETEEQLKEPGWDSCWYSYDFLLGNGSLGYPFKPSKVGKAVDRIGGQLGLTVGWNMENSYAKFSGTITSEAIEEAFYPIWEESERMKAQDKP